MMNTTETMPTEAEFEAMGGAIQHRAMRANRRRHRRNVGIVASVATAALLSGTGAVVLATTAMQQAVTYCYQAADLGSVYTQVATPTDVRDAQGRPVEAAVGEAVDKCASVWRIGFFETGGVPENDGKSYPVPQLQLCVRPDGVSAVLPRDSFTGSDAAFCNELGLAQP